MSAEAVLSNRPVEAPSRLLMSGNEAVARAVWEAGVRVAAAYPGTPATEMLECVATYPDIYAEWSVNEKVSLEVAFGAAMAGSRSFCAMKHVGMNVASDALMTRPRRCSAPLFCLASNSRYLCEALASARSNTRL